MPADKSQDLGVQILNTLFKSGWLKIFDTVENQALVQEILSLALVIDKRKAKDDRIDALRYSCTRLPWRWDKLGLDPYIPAPKPFKQEMPDQSRERRVDAFNTKTPNEQSVEEQISEWNEYYEPFS
jgi:hypothetical protein